MVKISNIKNKNTIAKLIVVFALLASIFGVYYLLIRNSYISSSSLESSYPKGAVAFTMDEDVKDGLVPVHLKFKTGNGSEVESISSITFKLKVSTTSGIPFVVTDRDGNKVLDVGLAENLISGDWKVPVNKVEDLGEETNISMALVNTNLVGYTAKMWEPVGTFYVKGLNAKEDLQLEFDKTHSVVLSKNRPVTDIWTY